MITHVNRIRKMEFKHRQSFENNLQSNSNQSLDKQHYSSSDSPYLNGSRSRINIPVCCMITNYSTPQCNPETQQNSQLDSSNGIEKNCPNNSSQLPEMCLKTRLNTEMNQTCQLLIRPNNGWKSNSNFRQTEEKNFKCQLTSSPE